MNKLQRAKAYVVELVLTYKQLRMDKAENFYFSEPAYVRFDTFRQCLEDFVGHGHGRTIPREFKPYFCINFFSGKAYFWKDAGKGVITIPFPKDELYYLLENEFNRLKTGQLELF